MRFTAVVMGISITVIWILGFFVALPELLYQKLGRTYPSQFTEYLTYCTLELDLYDKQAYQMFLTSGLYGFPMCLMFFAYSIIGVRLCKSSFPGTHETQNGLKAKFRQEFRSAIRTCRSPCRRRAKVPITIYNYRGHRSFQLNRTTERYSMNTLTSRQQMNPKPLKSKKTTALDKL
ncbi:hypothetical protein ACJMK2_042228 [Sinanodonta woodiana]|uniref:G-protein coupled receptors family 1 profile domain-containing protein n=1 Tax=Sinanodonta woodiana TaxID=1069815 RepID=A0ABD3WAH5_SINWO